MKKAISFLIIVFLTVTAYSQTFEEFKKQRQQELQQMKQEQNEAILKLQKEYDDFIKERDKEFADYLEQEWKAFKQYKAVRRLPEPKPITIPTFNPDQIVNDRKPNVLPEEKDIDYPKQTPDLTETPEIVEKPDTPKPDTVLPDIPRVQPTILPIFKIVPIEEVVLDQPTVRPEDVKPVIQKSIPQDIRHDIIEIDFYGRELVFEIDPKFQQFRVTSITESNLSEAWTMLSESDASTLIHQADAYKHQLNLNDWALLKLFEKVSDELTATENESTTMTWFLMNRSGYNVRIAYSGQSLSLLIPTTTQLYGVKYLVLDGKKFFIHTPLNSNEIYTYEAPYALADKDLDLHIYRTMMLGNDVVGKDYSFTYEGKEHNYRVAYNRSHVKFYEEYPITDIEVYLNAPVSESLKSTLNGVLKDVLKDKSDAEAVNYLLAMVQKSFEYKTDPEQFGREKFFFPEELFYYPYSDCEDRSALFSYLIREVRGLPVVGLDYPGHLATAVKIDGAQGAYVSVDNEHYVVADPTYINAPYGLVMPQFKSAQVKIVPVKAGEMFLAKRFWDIANEANGYRGGAMQDYAFAEDGSCYLTGYYTDQLNLGNSNLEGNGKKQSFIAAFGNNGTVKWVKNLKSIGDEAYNYANAITLVDNTPVISGVFEGDMSIDNQRIASDASSWYVCKLNNNNQSQWIKKVNIQSNIDNQRLIAQYSSSGRLIDQKAYPAADILNSMEGLAFLDGKIILSGNANVLPGTADKSYASGAEMNYVDLLKTTSDDLMSKDVNEGIAGLFAVTTLLQQNGYLIPGSEAQKALDKYNPSFKKRSPEIYNSIGTIDFLKNSDGIVTILTNKKSVIIDKVKINDKAKLKVVPLADGNHRIDILSGIEVGKYFVWYDLNMVTLYRNTGNMLFDYDEDHTHKIFNLKKDILN